MSRRSMGGTRVHLILTPQQIAKLQEHIKKTGLSLSEILRRAVDAYFRNKDV